MITTFNFNQPFRAGLHEKTLLRKARALNENIVQNQLNKEFLNVF